MALEELRGFAPFERLNERIAAFPREGDTVTAIFTQVIERLAEEFNQKLVETVLTLLASARRGLSDRELQELVAGLDRTDDLFPVLRQLRPYLMKRGPLIDCFHSALTKATRHTFLKSRATEKSLHGRLGAMFLSRCNREGVISWDDALPRTIQELAYHLTEAGAVEFEHEIITWGSVLLDPLFLDAAARSFSLRDILPYYSRESDTYASDVLAFLQRHISTFDRLPMALLPLAWENAIASSNDISRFRSSHAGAAGLFRYSRSGGDSQPTGLALSRFSTFVSSWGLAVDPHDGTVYSGGDDGAVRAWDRELLKERELIVTHQNSVSAMAISMDGKWLLSCDMGGAIALVELATRRIRWESASCFGIWCAVFDRESSRFAVGGAYGKCTVWSVDPLHQLAETQYWNHTNRSIGGLAFSPDGELLFQGGRDGHLRCWPWRESPRNGWGLRADRIFPTLRPITGMVAIYPAGGYVCTRSTGEVVKLNLSENPASRRTRALFQTAVIAQVGDRINCISTWASAGIVAAGTSRGRVLLCDAENQSVLLDATISQSPVRSLALADGGTTCFAACDDGYVYRYDSRKNSGGSLAPVPTQFNPSGNRLVSGMPDQDLERLVEELQSGTRALRSPAVIRWCNASEKNTGDMPAGVIDDYFVSERPARKLRSVVHGIPRAYSPCGRAILYTDGRPRNDGLSSNREFQLVVNESMASAGGSFIIGSDAQGVFAGKIRTLGGPISLRADTQRWEPQYAKLFADVSRQDNIVFACDEYPPFYQQSTHYALTSDGRDLIVAFSHSDHTSYVAYSLSTTTPGLRAQLGTCVTAVACSRGPSRVAVGQMTGRLNVFDFEQDVYVNPVPCLMGTRDLGGKITALLLSPDGRSVVAGLQTGNVFFGRTDSLDTLSMLPLQHGPIEHIVALNDGEILLIIGTNGDASICLVRSDHHESNKIHCVSQICFPGRVDWVWPFDGRHPVLRIAGETIAYLLL